MSRDFVGWFYSVAPYIHAHRGKLLVAAVPGEAFLDDAFTHLSYDLGLLSSLGMKILLVYGARPQIDARLSAVGIETTRHKGVRVTSEAALSVIKETVGAMRIDIEARLSIGLIDSPMRHAALRVASGNYVLAKPLGVIDGVDHQYTGVVRRVDVEAIRSALASNQLVLASPIGYSLTGEAFNLHYETLAASLAVALTADKLIYLASESTMAHLPQDGEYTVTQLEAGLAGTVDLNGSEPTARLLNRAAAACRDGVSRVHVLPVSVVGSLLLELFTHQGVGLMITRDPAETIRQAILSDIPGILRLIEPLEREGKVIRRDRHQLEADIDRFAVVEHDHSILGCLALYPLDEASAEMACFVVHPAHHHGGYGARMLAYAVAKARRMGLTRLFVLTTQTTHWFVEHGFQPIGVDALPLPKRAHYNAQRASKALVYDLASRPVGLRSLDG